MKRTTDVRDLLGPRPQPAPGAQGDDAPPSSVGHPEPAKRADHGKVLLLGFSFSLRKPRCGMQKLRRFCTDRSTSRKKTKRSLQQTGFLCEANPLRLQEHVTRLLQEVLLLGLPRCKASCSLRNVAWCCLSCAVLSVQDFVCSVLAVEAALSNFEVFLWHRT